MTPTPSPSPPELSQEALVLGVEAIVLSVIGLAIAVVVFLMLRALSREAPIIMVPFLVLVVTLTSLLLFAITREEGLETIAATGLGALAGALTYLYQQRWEPPSELDPELDDEDAQ